MFQCLKSFTYHWTWKSFQPFTRCFFWGEGSTTTGSFSNALRLSGGRRCGGLCVWDAQLGGGFGAEGVRSVGALFLASQKQLVFFEVIWGNPKNIPTKNTKFQEVWLEAALKGDAKTSDLSISSSPLGWRLGELGGRWGGIVWPGNLWIQHKSKLANPWHHGWPFRSVVLWNVPLHWRHINELFRLQKYRLPKCTHYPPPHFFHPYTFGIFWETKFRLDTYASDGWLNHHRHHHRHNNKARRCQMVVHLLH